MNYYFSLWQVVLIAFIFYIIGQSVQNRKFKKFILNIINPKFQEILKDVENRIDPGFIINKIEAFSDNLIYDNGLFTKWLKKTSKEIEEEKSSKIIKK
jgi:hypothetical protein